MGGLNLQSEISSKSLINFFITLLLLFAFRLGVAGVETGEFLCNSSSSYARHAFNYEHGNGNTRATNAPIARHMCVDRRSRVHGEKSRREQDEERRQGK